MIPELYRRVLMIFIFIFVVIIMLLFVVSALIILANVSGYWSIATILSIIFCIMSALVLGTMLAIYIYNFIRHIRQYRAEDDATLL